MDEKTLTYMDQRETATLRVTAFEAKEPHRTNPADRREQSERDGACFSFALESVTLSQDHADNAILLNDWLGTMSCGDSLTVRIGQRQMKTNSPGLSLHLDGTCRRNTPADAKVAAGRLRENVDALFCTAPEYRFLSAEKTATPAYKWRARIESCGLRLYPAGRRPGFIANEQPTGGIASLIVPTGIRREPGNGWIGLLRAFPPSAELRILLRPLEFNADTQKALAAAATWLDAQQVVCFDLATKRELSPTEAIPILETTARRLAALLTAGRACAVQIEIAARVPPPETVLALAARHILGDQRWRLVDALGEGYLSSDTLDLRGCLFPSDPSPVMLPPPSELLSLGVARAYTAPVSTPTGDGLLLGCNEARAIVLPHEDRLRHLYVMGASGSGKSTLLFNLIMQDIHAGYGVCVVDPHGDLFEDVLGAIPAGRRDDVILFDPSDFEHAVGLNFLECQGRFATVERNFVANEMIDIIDRLYDLRRTGGPMFEAYMRNALLLLMASEVKGLTLTEVPLLFEDDDFRAYVKAKCTEPTVVRFWEKQAERAGGENSLANMGPYVASKLNQFTTNALVRPIIGQSHSTIDLRAAMDGGRIVLANLPKGSLGALDCRLLGMLLLGKLLAAAMGRASLSAVKRRTFYVYVDEVQSFATEALAHMLSEARKFGLCLTLANQHLAQLDGGSGADRLLDSVLGNVGNLLLFRLGPRDAETLASFTRPELDVSDLQYLPDRHAVARLMAHQIPLRPFVLKTYDGRRWQQANAEAIRGAIRARSRRRHTTPTAVVEESIRRRGSVE